jgi:peptidoglycan/xylan/chitin deacetylase (PgdA/CDA1 family)
MRIVHFLSQTQLTGAETHVQALVQNQTQRGHQVWVFSEKVHVAFACPVILVPVAEPSFSQKRKLIADFRKFLLEEKIDLIHCHSRAAVRIAHRARKKINVAQVSTLHGRQHFSWSKKWFDHYGEYLIAICENAKQAHQKDFGTDPGKIKILENPIDIDLFPFSKSSQALGRAAYVGRATGPKGKYFGDFVASLIRSPEFSQSSFQIDIWAHNSEAFPQSLHEAVQKFPNHFRLCGAHTDLKSLYPDYGMVIGAGRVAMEATLMGTAVFALGETECIGLLTSENLEKAWKSNFGDITAESKPIDWELAARHFLKYTAQSSVTTESEILAKKMQLKVSSTRICSKLEEIYKAAIFKRHVPNWIPALMYHKVPIETIDSQHRIFVVKDVFEKHLRFFEQQGFTSLHFKDLAAFWNLRKPYSQFPTKPLLITFDDGYADNLENAEPLLKKHGQKANLFLLANENIQENTWDVKQGEKPYALMGPEERKKLDLNVWEIGSHGFSHQSLPQMQDSELFSELTESKSILEKSFSQEIFCLAYPFGDVDARSPAAAETAGYLFAVNTDQGGLHLADAPRSIFRVNIFPEDGLFQIWKKTRPGYRKYFFRKRKR